MAVMCYYCSTEKRPGKRTAAIYRLRQPSAESDVLLARWLFASPILAVPLLPPARSASSLPGGPTSDGTVSGQCEG